MVTPHHVQEEELTDLSMVDLGNLQTDACLYVLPELIQEGKRERLHTVLHMPSEVPEAVMGKHSPSASFNILMVDVSASMSTYWKDVVQGWNKHVAPTLTGRTMLYAFGNRVLFLRCGTELKQEDFISGGTDLVGALRTIISEVYQCREKYIKVFLITDGDHTVSKVKPESVIEKMKCAMGKICDVFVLGVGNDFPVQHSIDIRSRLHNGNSNLPYLFTAESSKDIMEQMHAIGRGSCSSNAAKIKLSVRGSALPGGDITDTFHLGEWVYFPCEPEQVQQLTLTCGRRTFSITLQPRPIPILDLNEMFRQWNSLIIQRHRKGEAVSQDIMALKERLFSTWMIKLKNRGTLTVLDRLAQKEMKTHEANFRANINKMKAILTTKNFQNDQELADQVLYTTVGGSKYETKVFQMKGHTNSDFEKVREEFMKVYEAHKANIQTIETTPEDCCRITLTSTVSDLQDSNFAELLQLGKFEFLKQFTITGIPVFSPIRDSMIINPWSYSVRAMLTSPYTILSQVALESFAEVKPAGEQHKDVKVKWDEANTRFNAIVPVFPPCAAKIMEPIVHTRLYAMCATFAILKNPHIIDFNVHMAALAITWMRILYEYPTQPRPEFVRSRIECIEATAALYIKQSSYATYWKMLQRNTAQALMTESIEKVDNKTVKCESLIKPMFILHMNQQGEDRQDSDVVARMVRMILVEYIGRCLERYKAKDKAAMPFTDFFVETLVEHNKKGKWVRTYVENIKANLTVSLDTILKKFYTLEEVTKAARQIAREQLQVMKEKFTADLPIKVNMGKVAHLHNVSGAGDVSWHTLKVFAREANLTENIISDLFSEKSVFMYVAHALKYRTSRTRLTAPLDDFDVSLATVTKRIQNESFSYFAKGLNVEIQQHVENAWLETYLAAHREVVHPMTPQEIVMQARQRGIEVTDTTFYQVYQKYRPDVGLLGNACQSQSCPFYLIPNKRYNQHASVERQGTPNFPHSLHRIAYIDRNKDLATAIDHFSSGICTKTQMPLHPRVITKFSNDLKRLQDDYKMNLPGS